MSFNAHVGSFTVPTTGGNNPVVTGLGFQPKAVIFFGNTRTADGKSTSTGTNADMPMTVLGMATSSTAQASLVDNDDFSGGDVGFEGSNCLFLANGAGTTVTSATMVSMDAGGFTLDFTFVDGTAHVVNYLALGGSDLSANIVAFTPPTSNTASFAITGAGFKPTGVIFIGGQAGLALSGGLGWTDGTNQGANSSRYGGSGFHQESTTWSYDNVGRFNANIVSLDANGCTLDYTSTTASGAESAAALFLAGINVHAGTFNTATATGNQSITGVGFQPSAVLLSSVAEAPSGGTAGTSWIVHTLGAMDGTNEATVWASDWTNGNASLDRTHVLHFLNDDATPSDMVLASAVSLDANGFTLDYTAINATAREVIYLALGQVSGGGAVAVKNPLIVPQGVNRAASF